VKSATSTRDALYFRVSSDRQTTENQFDELLTVAHKDNTERDWERIRTDLGCSIITDTRITRRGATRTLYRVDAATAERLAKECIYVEQGRSSKRGAQKRPLFERMKRDASQRRFTRLLVWKVSRLGRDMREVISTVYELADLGVTIVPVKSQTGPVNTAMGRLLWAIQAWYGEMENEERSENVRLGQARARAQGKEIGRPREVGDDMEQQILALRANGHGYKIIAQRTGVSRSTIRRILKGAESMPKTQPLNPASSVPADAVL
jgi:DNA invertase Pin-like site-specific DNA recombinase